MCVAKTCRRRRRQMRMDMRYSAPRKDATAGQRKQAKQLAEARERAQRTKNKG